MFVTSSVFYPCISSSLSEALQTINFQTLNPDDIKLLDEMQVSHVFVLLTTAFPFMLVDGASISSSCALQAEVHVHIY